jgi:ComF family protein
MNNPSELAISLVAPHYCVGCNTENTLLCQSCQAVYIITPPSRCYLCHKATKQNQLCTSCLRKSSLKNVWVAAEYEEIPRRLVHKLKFKRAKSVASLLAGIMADNLPDLAADTMVTHVPTANKRIRMRGYDQSKLIAQALSQKRRWKYVELLDRKGFSRQVGSSRKARISQMENAFSAKRPATKNKNVLIVDDITTTGATLEAAAKVLKSRGAKNIQAVVFAQPD